MGCFFRKNKEKQNDIEKYIYIYILFSLDLDIISLYKIITSSEFHAIRMD